MKNILLVSLLISYSLAKAQDPAFSNVFNASSYYHPSLSSIQKGIELNTSYRNHWPKIPYLYESYNANIMGQFAIPTLSNWNFAIGASMMKDEEGVGNLVTTNIKGVLRARLIFDKNVEHGCSNSGSYLSMAFYYGTINKKIDYSGLVFSDQIQTNGQITTPNVNYNNYNQESTGKDLGISGTYFNNKFWSDHYLVASLSAHHLLNKDEASFENNDASLPAFWVVSLSNGNQWTNKNKRTLLYRATIQYEKQSSISRFSAGLFGGIAFLKSEEGDSRNEISQGISFGIDVNYNGLHFNNDYTNALTFGLSVRFSIQKVLIRCGLTYDAFITTGLTSNNTGHSNEIFTNILWDKCMEKECIGCGCAY